MPLRNLREFIEVIERFTHEGWWDWHLKDDYEYMSPMFWETLGYDKVADNIPDHPSAWQDKIHPEDLKRCLVNFDQHVESRGAVPYQQKVRYRHKDGSTVWIVCKGAVVEWADDGSPVRMVGVHIDITELQNKIQQLEDHDEVLKTIRAIAREAESWNS